MPFVLPQKVYEIIRWVVSIVLPSLVAFYVVVATEFNWPYTTSVFKIASSFESIFVAILCIIKLYYDLKKTKEESLNE